MVHFKLRLMLATILTHIVLHTKSDSHQVKDVITEILEHSLQQNKINDNNEKCFFCYTSGRDGGITFSARAPIHHSIESEAVDGSLSGICEGVSHLPVAIENPDETAPLVCLGVVIL